MSTVHRDSAFRQAREALDQLESSTVEEDELAVELKRLAEAWKLLHETVERGLRENAAAQKEHAAALACADNICDSAIHEVEEMLGPLQAAKGKLDASQEALEAEAVSKHQEIDAHEK